MRDYEKVPHDLSADTNLSIGSRALYPLLRRLAWENGRRDPDDAVEMPTMPAIAAVLGVADSTCRTYLAELRSTGWVETIRASRRRPSLWIIRDDPSAPKIGGLKVAESAEKQAPSPPNIGGHTISLTDEANGETTSPPTEDSAPPAVWLDKSGGGRGRNLPLDALLEVCNLDPSSPRVGQAIAALNGTTRPVKEGIRQLFWRECVRYAETSERLDELADLAEDPESFARALVRQIIRKAELYAERMPGAERSPTALRDWWLDLERRPSNATMSADDIRRYASE